MTVQLSTTYPIFIRSYSSHFASNDVIKLSPAYGGKLGEVKLIQSQAFYRSVLDSVSEQIAVIDRDGGIRFVNDAWVRFGVENNCRIEPEQWKDINYLDVCDHSGKKGEAFGGRAAAGIREVIDRSLQVFNIEYPCHSPNEKRWFTMTVTSLDMAGEPYYAISHQNITQRKLAEEHVLSLSRMDGLTNIPNRRYFDQFLSEEWKRCRRLESPISLAILDIDHFKLLNDHYGHPYGDNCLVQIGHVLNNIKKRPSDLFARYGGEEFSFVFGNSTTEQALVLIRNIVDEIRAMSIPNEKSPTKPIVTVSVGLATVFPNENNNEKELIAMADANLYKAKTDGRDRIVC